MNIHHCPYKYNDVYNEIIGNYKNKHTSLNLLMKHLNILSNDVNISNRMLQELRIEKMMLLEKLLDIKNTLDNLRM